jgi:hypothetical protein
MQQQPAKALKLSAFIESLLFIKVLFTFIHHNSDNPPLQ